MLLGFGGAANNLIISKATGVLDELAFRGYVTISIFAVYKLQLLINLFLNADFNILKIIKMRKETQSTLN